MRKFMESIKGKKTVVVLICLLFIILCVHVWLNKNTRVMKKKITELLADRPIALCRLADLTEFSWEKAEFIRSGLLLTGLTITFSNNTEQTISLPLRKYYAAEDYVAHSPIGKEFSPDSCFILSYYPYVEHKRIYIQSISEDEHFFLRQLLNALNSRNSTFLIKSLTHFKWRSLKINRKINQYIYVLDFLDEKENVVRKITLPDHVIEFNDGVEYSQFGVDAIGTVKISKTGILFRCS